ncbi:TetR/AcrR family transcriptional regulator [Symbioplanes lichenis]|uniref:TetR/AcrR family transcriptional regulator n=1 Tax=Symbioplanes lichenis TaxID=1629072 RepID=UPI002738E1A0|nr:TetR/AcrR family transcriptional regulator [Actinoplanes lichenis]
MRADAQRNYDRIVSVADDLVSRDGAEVSLEEVARRAGVGSATLHRHFPGRLALLEAVFRDRIAGLLDRARELAETGPPGDSLVVWLHEVNTYVTTSRGLAAALLAHGEHLAEDDTCGAKTAAAGELLVSQAKAVGRVRPSVSAEDLIVLVSGISLAVGGDSERSRRLLDLALAGIAPAATSG